MLLQPLSFTLRFYKKYRVPDLDRIGVRVEQKFITTAHANNTLIITVCAPPHSSSHIQYEKPPAFLAFEIKLKACLFYLDVLMTQALRDSLKASKEGDVDCKAS